LKQELACKKKEIEQLRSNLSSAKDVKDSLIISKDKLHEESERKLKQTEVFFCLLLTYFCDAKIPA